ncbi:MAG: hypothetical protein QXX08_09565 [Candidatus Bathyarchaeia archaeon]
MADWRAVYENWEQIPEENKRLIESLMKEKPKEKLAGLFSREPYAKMVYEKVIGKWQPPTQPRPQSNSALDEFSHQERRENLIEDARITEKVAVESIKHVPTRNIAFSLLPIASILSLLLAEVFYYNSSLTMSLDRVLPFNLRTWVLMLSSALALGLVTVSYILKHAKRDMAQDRGFTFNILRKSSITASAFVPMFRKIEIKSDEELAEKRRKTQS